MFGQLDTIAAIATAFTNGGIGIVRLSGVDAFQILQKLFKTKESVAQMQSHTIHYGHIEDEGQRLDEVLVSVMRAPRTYTREDVVEIQCHGGIVTVSKILEAVLKHGARLAERGEFTKRAFLNGRIDLSQAEAVIDLINAKTSLSQENALKQLEGRLSAQIQHIRQALLLLIANIEASIDYPEHDMESMNLTAIYEKTTAFLPQIEGLLATADRGQLLKEGIETVIIGRPNVGKSSLLNKLLSEERAIVTDIPGTTRDILQEMIHIQGIPLKIVDTAGIRETTDTIEQLGVERSKAYAQRADLILLVLDGSQPICSEDLEILESVKDKKILVLVNKLDLPKNYQKESITTFVAEEYIIELSLKEDKGLEALYEKIQLLFDTNAIATGSEVLVTNVRHKNALLQAKQSLTQVLSAIDMGMTEDFISIDLQDAYHSLGEIIGETIRDDIMDKIFSEFCLGK